jgi:hypothetical protein
MPRCTLGKDLGPPAGVHGHQVFVYGRCCPRLHAWFFFFLPGDTSSFSMAAALCALPNLGHPPWLPCRANRAVVGLARAHCCATTLDELSAVPWPASTCERAATLLPGKHASGPPRCRPASTRASYCVGPPCAKGQECRHRPC